MTLTKTDFKEFLLCNKCLWVKKIKPELYIEGEFSLFLQKLIKDGYDVEKYVQKLFPDGQEISGDKENLLTQTKKLLEEKQTMFQATFESKEGLFAKVDVLKFNTSSKKWDLYEIKASSEIKTDIKHNHIKDVTFQTILAENEGVEIGTSNVIYINRVYRREGEINLYSLFVIEDVSDQVRKVKDIVKNEIEFALEMLSRKEISLNGCECLYKSNGQQCDMFGIFNPQVPAYSVHNILLGKKLVELVDMKIFDVTDIPHDFELTDIQKGKVNLQKIGKPIIDTQSIENTLSELVFPLYFLDYETYASPIPLLDKYKTNQQLVFQVSLHVLQADGKLEHFEYLADKLEGATKGLLETLTKHIGPTGNVVVWYESFEKGRNIELAELHPEYKDFLLDINERVFDLMKVFKKDYTHPDFHGSASIKNVLPALLPELSYKTLEIQNGTMALSEWEKMIQGNLTDEERKNIRENLLKYCALDTLAMVEIYRKLTEL
jgi:CRISPR/Cas system-associated exonuclease Cas4 (RecB family)